MNDRHLTRGDRLSGVISAADLPQPELDSLRRALLDMPDRNPGLDAATLRQHLALCGHAETLGTLAMTIARHAGFAARGGDDPEVIVQGLREILQLLQTGGARDVTAAGRAFATDPSAENSRRLTALKERELQDGPIGGVDS